MIYCTKCGNELREDARFCPKCGAQVSRATENDDNKTLLITDAPNSDSTVLIEPQSKQEQVNEPPIIPPVIPIDVNNSNIPLPSQPPERGKLGRKVASIIGLVFIVLCLIGAIGYMFFFDKDGEKELSFEGKMKKAQEMMDEGNYGDAIGYYKAALEEDPESVEAYEGLAEAYIERDKLEEAIKILETGYDVTGEEDLKKLLEKIEKRMSDEKEQETEEDGASEEEEDALEAYSGEKTDINIEVRQVDNSQFPEVTLYASVVDENGNTIEKLDRTDFNIKEIDRNGNVIDASIEDVYQVLDEDKISVNLVLDASASMNSYNKMQQAKNAAASFVNQMELNKGDQVEVISFDDFVYLEQEFSSQKEIIQNAIDNIGTYGNTALYDALYAGLFQTYYEDGAKCVIGFTDGMENASSYTFNDVVAMAQSTGIPVFIIGIGEEYDADALQSLASQCSGKYYSANVNDLETILEDIYVSIYHEQQDYYVFKYTTTNEDNLTQFRDVVLETSETTEFSGSYKKAYVPQTDISGAFSSAYMNLDYILDFSGQREVTEADLAGLSLAELRIARNEIFARHGRQFKDSMLNQWFYSKTWYLNIPAKFSPSDFDAMRPSPLSRLEIDNADFIKAYEDSIMSTQDIFPNANSVLLSDYDLALSKIVLKNALNQMQAYPSTSILEENKRLVQEAINKEDVQY